MSLRDLALRCEYRSDETNLVEDFYIPCLRHSTEYWRAVGYFTSQGLLLAAEGLAAFLKHDGHMRLVASPWLDEADVDALLQGYAAREDVVLRAVLRQCEHAFAAGVSGLLRHRLACLAWLVAEERLEIKLACPSAEMLHHGRGIFHEKVGLFWDAEEEVVAFTGSPNETVGGLVSNFESIDVFWSWDDPHQRIPRKVENFRRLWENRTPRLHVLDFPQAARDCLLHVRPIEPPSIDAERRYATTPPLIAEGRMEYTPGGYRMPPQRKGLWPHQQEAIEAWEGHGRIGLLSMATGSGKTLTALVAAERCPALQLVVIAVPRANLVEQWARELRENTCFPTPFWSMSTTRRGKSASFHNYGPPEQEA